MNDLADDISDMDLKVMQIDALLYIWQESFKKNCEESYFIGVLQGLVLEVKKKLDKLDGQAVNIENQKKPEIENNEINISKVKFKDLLDKSEHLEALMIPVGKAVTDEADTDTVTLTNLASSLASDLAQEIRILEGA
ncbi:hypothetical protein [Photorhabdus temperata]|uniref:Uncharacterized protein n=1 Tax=Photorhabdus temperata subsp. temperata Meg1 TaxID=1393735 RepID=A0A081RQV7_PHOTE|nr:hypothetical protein [Photorhabdus temperata]KER01060.1 hypothetical protein MEG1DRAFT_04331 [Photorhabdus temperata subsp. temperata Meg1]